MLIKRLSIIGVGLIGGSLARALRRAGQCTEVVGCGRNVENLETAIELGVIDRYSTSTAEAVEGADMVVVAVPLGSIAGSFAAMREALGETAIVTDVGSAKGSVVADARANLGSHMPYFVPGHPIAGAEKSGVTASFADLFEKRKVILTPTEETVPEALETVRKMWDYTGACVVDMGVAHHDDVLAATSHLPHMLAYALVDMLAHMDSHTEIFRYAAGGFRDFTRIASSDPRMWHDICIANREPLLKMLKEFDAYLQHLAESIEQQDSKAIESMFIRAKEARDAFAG